MTTVVDNTIAAVDTVSDNVTESTSELFDKQITLIENTFKNLREQIANLKKMKKEVSLLEKRSKSGKKRAKKDPSAPVSDKQSGFKIPTKISDELCDFLKVPRGSLVPRADVTRMISKYVKDNGLGDGRLFKFTDTPESKTFEKLLDVSNIGESKPGYLILQKCIKHHFIKEIKDVKPAEKTVKPVEKPVEKAVKPVEKPVEKPADEVPKKKVIRKLAAHA